MVEEYQAHGDAYHGCHFPDLSVCRLWMRTPCMGQMYWTWEIRMCTRRSLRVSRKA